MAKRALETTGQIFRFGIAHGYTKRNPAAEIKPRDILRPTKKTNLPRVDVKEVPALLRSIEVYQGTHITRLAMKLLALTFVRTTELIGARWEEFDLEARRWCPHRQSRFWNCSGHWQGAKNYCSLVTAIPISR